MAYPGWELHDRFEQALMEIMRSPPPATLKGVHKVTQLALASSKWYKCVVHCLEKHISKCPKGHKISCVYIIDSICRASKSKTKGEDVFVPRFARNLPITFSYVPPTDSTQVQKVLALWKESQLFSLDVIKSVEKMFTKKIDDGSQKDKKSTTPLAVHKSRETVSYNSPEVLNECPPTPKLRTAVPEGNVMQYSVPAGYSVPLAQPPHMFVPIDPQNHICYLEPIQTLPMMNPHPFVVNNQSSYLPPPPPPVMEIPKPKPPTEPTSYNPMLNSGNEQQDDITLAFDYGEEGDAEKVMKRQKLETAQMQMQMQLQLQMQTQTQTQSDQTCRVVTTVLYVSPILPSTSRTDIYTFFNQFGKVISLKHKSGESMAFVTLETRKQAESIIQANLKTPFNFFGQTLTINWARGMIPKANYNERDGTAVVPADSFFLNPLRGVEIVNE